MIREEDLAPLKALTFLKFMGVCIDHSTMGSLAASLGNPAWFTKSPVTFDEPEGQEGPDGPEAGACGTHVGGTSRAARGPKSPKGAAVGAVSPHGSHMLGGFSPKSPAGPRRVDAWAQGFGFDDKEAGYFAQDPIPLPEEVVVE